MAAGRASGQEPAVRGVSSVCISCLSADIVNEPLTCAAANQHLHTHSHTSLCCMQSIDWERVTVKTLPEQHDGGSCGVFMCMYAEHLLAGSDPSHAFSQSDIPGLRLHMAASLLHAFWQEEEPPSGVHSIPDQSLVSIVQCNLSIKYFLTSHAHHRSKLAGHCTYQDCTWCTGSNAVSAVGHMPMS